VPLGFVAACIAAGVMATLGIFGMEYFDMDVSGYYAASVIVMTFWAGAIAFLPAAIAIVLAESFGWRSALYYLLAGGLLGAIAIHLTMQSGAFDFADRPNVALLAAGFVGGFVYWMIAGRLAGTGFARAMPGKARPGHRSGVDPGSQSDEENSTGSASGQA
jgi:hypothetical protein